MTDFDRTIARIAAEQHGVFSIEQVKQRGGSYRMAQRRVAEGRWIALARGVYRIAGAPATFHGDLMAATLLTSGSAVSDAPGAALHQMTGFGPCWPEVTTTVGRCHDSPLATVHRRERYRTTKVRGIRVGTVDQIVGDLAGSVPLRKLERTVDDALLERRVHLDRIEDLAVERSVQRGRGAVDLRSLVEARCDGDPVPESELEVPLHAILTSPGVPEVEFQMRVPWAPHLPSRIDACIRRWMMIVEADGRRWHTRVADFESDRRRDRLGLRIGFVTVRFTYADLTLDYDESLAELLAIGAERERLLHGC